MLKEKELASFMLFLLVFTRWFLLPFIFFPDLLASAFFFHFIRFFTPASVSHLFALAAHPMFFLVFHFATFAPIMQFFFCLLFRITIMLLNQSNQFFIVAI